MNDTALIERPTSLRCNETGPRPDASDMRLVEELQRQRYALMRGPETAAWLDFPMREWPRSHPSRRRWRWF